MVPDPRKITKWSSIFSKFSNWSSKYSTSPLSSQNSQISPLSNPKLQIIPQFLKLQFNPQVLQNYHSGIMQNFKSVPKCQISISVLKIFRVMQHFSCSPCDIKLHQKVPKTETLETRRSNPPTLPPIIL